MKLPAICFAKLLLMLATSAVNVHCADNERVKLDQPQVNVDAIDQVNLVAKDIEAKDIEAKDIEAIDGQATANTKPISLTAAQIKVVLEQINQSMVAVPAGKFLMGSPEDEPKRLSNEGPQQQIDVSTFKIGKTEVTSLQWLACVADGGCSHRPDLPDQSVETYAHFPVVNVSYHDITTQFLPWLNEKTGKYYHLPSEAQWEYAARAGSTSRFNTGDCISTDQATYYGAYPAQNCPKGQVASHPTPVGSLPGNAFGLHDMHGNVSEWTAQCYTQTLGTQKPNSSTDNSKNQPESCDLRVVRGGSWMDRASSLRSAARLGANPDGRSEIDGFRLAL